MKKMKIDWNRHVPLGMDGEKTKNWMVGMLGAGIGILVTALIKRKRR